MASFFTLVENENFPVVTKDKPIGILLDNGAQIVIQGISKNEIVITTQGKDHPHLVIFPHYQSSGLGIVLTTSLEEEET